MYEDIKCFEKIFKPQTHALFTHIITVDIRYFPNCSTPDPLGKWAANKETSLWLVSHFRTISSFKQENTCPFWQNTSSQGPVLIHVNKGVNHTCIRAFTVEMSSSLLKIWYHEFRRNLFWCIFMGNGAKTVSYSINTCSCTTFGREYIQYYHL